MEARCGAIIGAALVVLTSCTHAVTSAPGAPTVLTSTRMIMNDDAAMILTKARCHRESTCDNVGPFRRFTDRNACLQELFPDADEVVRPEECPAGVDEAKLSACVSDVLDEMCMTPRATAGEPASCRRSELCVTP